MLYMPEREEMYPAEVLTKVSVRAVTETKGNALSCHPPALNIGA
jgi:hypothetical protein